MADDDKDKDEGFDPWADLESDPAPALDAFIEELDPQPAGGALEETGQPASAEAAADDDLAASWLDDIADEPTGGQPLSVFTPDEPAETGSTGDDDVAAGFSSIEIGTGESGVHSPSSIDPFNAMAEDESSESIETIAIGFTESPLPEDDSTEQAPPLDFGPAAAVVAGGAAVAAVGPAAKSREKPKPRKKSPLGQLFGIVMGGAMAIPVTLGILIWGFQKDPFKVTKHVPESVAFLLPQKFQPGGVRNVGNEPGPTTGPTLDDLPRMDESLAAVDAVSPEPTAVEEPAAGDAAATDDLAAGDGLDDLLQKPAAVEPQTPPLPVVPEPEPLDLSGLEQAVADATATLDVVKSGADPAGSPRTGRLVGWYKQLARVAQEFAMLEHVAADSGRPLTATPDKVAELHAAILADPVLLDDLARLTRNWLAYSKRGGDGVVMPATFAGSRQVGPYWSSRVSIVEAGGGARELAVISRAEPAALPGDLILITGLAMDGDVVWASDLRSATAGAPAGSDPFGQSAP